MKTQTYEGGCHCGKVTFRVEADLSQVMTCNCSHCSMRGFILHFVSPDKFELLTGKDELTEYRFNKKVIQHLFCKTCGIEGFGYGKGPDGKDMVMINVCCLEGVDLEALQPTMFNGRDLM